jgi:hypothetical protein
MGQKINSRFYARTREGSRSIAINGKEDHLVLSLAGERVSKEQKSFLELLLGKSTRANAQNVISDKLGIQRPAETYKLRSTCLKAQEARLAASICWGERPAGGCVR